MEAIPSPAEVLEAAIDRGISARRLCRALAQVARAAAVGAIERDGALLRRALTAAFAVGYGEDPHGELARAIELARAVLERSRRRINSESAVAAAQCAIASLELARDVSLGVTGPTRRAFELLSAAAAAIDRQYTWPRTSADQVSCTLAAFLPADIKGWPDYGEVALRLMRPAHRDKPTLDAVARAVEGLSDGAEAWETLAARSVIPVEWAGDQARSFRGATRDRWGRVRRTVDEAPPDVQSAVSLATDPDGLLAAERLAREFASSLRAWNQREPSHFEWAVLDRRGMLDVYRGPWPPQLERALRNIRLSTAERAWAEGRAATAANVEWSDSYVPAGLREALSLAEFWRVMVELDARFPTSDPVPEPWQGSRVAEVPCALASLLSLWTLGYALVSLDGERAHLAAPMAELP